MQIDIRKYKDKGYTGLANLGNTCFLNSTIQILNHTYELIEVLEREKTKKIIKYESDDYAILREWNELRELMMASEGYISPNKFVYYVQTVAGKKDRDIFTGWAQNDMPEFLLFFIDCIHNCLCRNTNIRIKGEPENDLDKMAIECYTMLKNSYSREYSEIMELFYGIFVTQILSPDGTQIHTIRPEQYFIVDLPIADKKEITIYDCFDLFTQSDIMEGSNAWYNEKTKQHENIQRKTTFWNFPNILVITFKRFTQFGNMKITNLIDFPLEDLDLTKYVHGYNAQTYKYDLFGICNHIGGVQGGHYTSFVKNASKKWVHYNDSNIEIMNNTNSLVTPMAYCLFYRKKNNLI